MWTNRLKLPSSLTVLPTILALFTLCAASLAQAATAPTPSAQDTINAMERANAAVVGITTQVPEDARSAETLGLRRQGSGVVIGADGLVLTIGYLVLEAETINITTQDNKVVPARVVAYDHATGFGLVQPLTPMRSIKPVAIAGAQDVALGSALMVSTGGEDGDVNMTQLVSKRAFSGTWEYFIDNALFTAPAIANHSGAPLFNQRGELIGIGSLVVANALGDQRRLPGNMFVPTALLTPILAELRQTGSSRSSKRPWIGLTSAEQSGRVQVLQVSKEGPAETAGLQAGDIVLAVDGAKVTSLESFYKKLWDHAEPDAQIQLTVLQGADIKTITLRATDRMRALAKPKGI